MTPKQKVLKKWPGAVGFPCWDKKSDVLEYVITDSTTSKTVRGVGKNARAAWADAARRIG